MLISKEFVSVLRDILVEDSSGQAQNRTGISKAYWGQLLNGKVPRPEALERIIDGYSDRITPEQIKRLYECAGYELPAKWSVPTTPLDSDSLLSALQLFRNKTALDDDTETLEKFKTAVIEILQIDANKESKNDT